MKTINTKNIFQNWGKANQQLPDNNLTLKNMILSKYNPSKLGPIYQKKSLPWLSLSFATLSILIFLSPLFQINQLATPKMDSSQSSVRQFENSERVGIVGKEYYPISPISDNREFIKTNYNATLKTRHVGELTNKFQVIIRGFGGRVDSSNVSPNYGYISFVVPASKFDTFKIEVRNMVGTRFYSEQISNQNLLQEKQSIEQRQADTQKITDSLQTERKRIITNHNNTVGSLQTRLNSVNEEINALKSEISTDPTRRAEIEARLAQLTDEKNTLNLNLSTENKNHQSNMVVLNNQIKTYESELESIKKQDHNLLDNIATVNGTIYLDGVNIWEVVNLYLPGHWLGWILLIVAIVSYLIRNRRHQIIIP